MIKRLFKAKKPNLSVDIHAHLIPGIDDGAKSVDEALDLMQSLQSMGYEKLVATPHIHSEVYPNNPEKIRASYEQLLKKMKTYGLAVKLEVAAEYYMDNSFLDAIVSGQELMTFADNHILIETSFYSKPLVFDEVIFELKAKGLQPVFAHPERYHYLEKDLSWLKSVRERGVLFQVNLLSLEGVYGKAPKKVAERLIEEKMVDFFGTDIHRSSQLSTLRRVLKKRFVLQNPKNNELL